MESSHLFSFYALKRMEAWSIDLICIDVHYAETTYTVKNKDPLFSCLIFIERHKDLMVRALDSAPYIV